MGVQLPDMQVRGPHGAGAAGAEDDGIVLDGTRSPPPALIEQHDEFAWRYEGGIRRPVLIL
jgi:hypothetical protein